MTKADEHRPRSRDDGGHHVVEVSEGEGREVRHHERLDGWSAVPNPDPGAVEHGDARLLPAASCERSVCELCVVQAPSAISLPEPLTAGRVEPHMILFAAVLAAHAAPYDVAVQALGEVRETLASEFAAAAPAERDAIREDARQAVLTAMDRHLFPAWYGTDWDFYGTSTKPGQGAIACGYFVSTTLQHAGFQVERVRLAQQASEHIIQTFVAEPGVKRFRDRPLDEVLEHLEDEGDGLYIVGLDYHVGYLRQDGDETRFCHSTYLGDSEVLCEPAATSPALVSRYRVVGKLLDDAMIDAWLKGESFATVGPRRR